MPYRLIYLSNACKQYLSCIRENCDVSYLEGIIKPKLFHLIYDSLFPNFHLATTPCSAYNRLLERSIHDAIQIKTGYFKVYFY